MSTPLKFDGHREMLVFCASASSRRDTIALEFGVYSGRSLQVIRTHFSGKVFGFDSFCGLPEDWREDYPAGTFATEDRPNVPDAEIIEGLFQDTLPSFLVTQQAPISFVHFDADLYSSTIFCLKQIAPYLDNQAIFVFDEYHNYEGYEEHEQRAFLEFKAQFPTFHTTKFAYVESDSPGENSEQVAFLVSRFPLTSEDDQRHVPPLTY